MSEILDKISEIITTIKESGQKPWYLSKTLWMDVIFIAAYFVQLKYGFVISPEEQIGIIAVANLVLRAISGKELTL